MTARRKGALPKHPNFANLTPEQQVAHVRHHHAEQLGSLAGRVAQHDWRHATSRLNHTHEKEANGS